MSNVISFTGAVTYRELLEEHLESLDDETANMSVGDLVIVGRSTDRSMLLSSLLITEPLALLGCISIAQAYLTNSLE